MKVFKCDRCGTTYDDNKPAFVVCDVSCAEKGNIQAELLPGNCIDLCPDCQEELGKFIGGKEK